MQNERDDSRAHAIEDAADALQVAEMHKQRTQRGDDQEVGKNESPAAGPGSPKAATQVGDKDADLNGKRPRQGLTDGHRLPHLVPRQPLAFANKLAFHLADQGDGSAEAHESEPQEVEDDIPDGNFAAVCMAASMATSY